LLLIFLYFRFSKEARRQENNGADFLFDQFHATQRRTLHKKSNAS